MSVVDLSDPDALKGLPRSQQNVVIYRYLYNVSRNLIRLRRFDYEIHKKLEEMERIHKFKSEILDFNDADSIGPEQYAHYYETTEGSMCSEDSRLSVERFEGVERRREFCPQHAAQYTKLEPLHQQHHLQPMERLPLSHQILQARRDKAKVVLNVGGEKHEVMWRLLERQQRSRLGLLALATTSDQILKLCDAFSLEDNEYYFDHHPRTFNCILNFYRTGKLHVMDELCVMDFYQDLGYWMIEDIYLEACCEGKYSLRKEHVLMEVKKNSKVKKNVGYQEDFGSGYCARYQECLWNLFEKPNSSFPAKVISLVSVMLVLISTMAMCLNTMPEFKLEDETGERTVENPVFALTEACCISWFTVEYLLRLAGARDKLQFIKRPLNIVDVLAILPYYLSLSLVDPETEGQRKVAGYVKSDNSITEVEEEEEVSLDDMSRIVMVFRIARILRIFKLARSSEGLQAIAHTMKTSYKELSLLLLFVGMGMLIFGTLAYFVEKDAVDTKYTSIPESMWWAIQTMTSVGYGDLYPTTLLGKFIGSCCGVSGILVMALPIPIVVENFGAYYMEQKKRAVITAKKQELESEKNAEAASGRFEKQQLSKLLQSESGPFKDKPPSPVSQ